MKNAALASLAACVSFVASAHAAPVDLSTWTAEGPGNWVTAADNNSVLQTLNDNPTLFFNGVNSQGKALSGSITVETTSDDDYVGFVLGYNAGDLTNDSASYILIDWKQIDQGSFGCTAQAGLAISQVSGAVGNDAGAWCHAPANNVTELARATNLGDTGWADNTTYTFKLTFTDSLIEVFVNDVLELSVSGAFADGSFGFYNYSQASVRYAGIQEDVVPPSEIPLPAALPLMAMGLGGLGFWSARRRKA